MFELFECWFVVIELDFFLCEFEKVLGCDVWICWWDFEVVFYCEEISLVEEFVVVSEFVFIVCLKFVLYSFGGWVFWLGRGGGCEICF